MVVGTTLVAGDDREVNKIFEIIQCLLTSLSVSLIKSLTEKDHGTTGPTERLVCRRGDNIGILKGAGDDASSDENRDIGYIGNKIGTDKVCDLVYTSIVDKAAVG